jgi:hypothetical protein
MNKIQTALAVAGLVLASSGANAAIVSGATVDFSFDTNDIFNSYTVIGDTLIFQATGLKSSATPSEGYNFADPVNTPLVTFTARSGYTLDLLDVTQFGSYTQIGTGQVAASATFTVNNPYGNTTSQSISSLTGINSFPSNLSTTWNSYDFAFLTTGTLAASAQTQTQLATVNAGGPGLNVASINVYQVEFGAFTTAVPVPGAFWLFGSALTGVLVTRRRVAA